MKKLTPLFILSLAFFYKAAHAQQVLKDFTKNIVEFSGARVINEHMGVVLVTPDDGSFEIVALNDQMAVLWTTKLKGAVFGYGKFKGKLVVAAATEYSNVKGLSSIYNAYVLDPQDGKLLSQKEIYHGTGEYQDYPSLYITGDIFKLTVRQSLVARKMFTTSRTSANESAAQDLTVINFNEQLEPVNTIKPVVKTDNFLGIRSNSRNDTFIGWVSDNGSVSVVKYSANTNEPAAELNEQIDLQSATVAGRFGNTNIGFFPASSNENVVLVAGILKSGDNTTPLTLSKFDFGNKTHQTITRVFDKDAYKTIEKNFAATGKDLPEPNLGTPETQLLRLAQESGGVIVIGMAASFELQMGHDSRYTRASWLICAFDLDLKAKFQQCFPSGFSIINGSAYGDGWEIRNNTLNMVANFKSNLFTIKSLFGQLDLANGQWRKIEALSKDDLDNLDESVGDKTLWFPGTYIVPYIRQHTFATSFGGRIKFGIMLQKNSL